MNFDMESHFHLPSLRQLHTTSLWTRVTAVAVLSSLNQFSSEVSYFYTNSLMAQLMTRATNEINLSILTELA